MPWSPAAAVDPVVSARQTHSRAAATSPGPPRGLPRPAEAPLTAGCASSSAVSPAGTAQCLCLHRHRLPSSSRRLHVPREQKSLSPLAQHVGYFLCERSQPLSFPCPETLFQEAFLECPARMPSAVSLRVMASVL